MFTVHYRDRRNNRRTVLNQQLAWHRFNYEEGNWSCDCNRSLDAYRAEPAMQVSCCSAHNIMVVEKVVVDGQIVFRDAGVEDGVESDAADMAQARLIGAAAAVGGLHMSLIDICHPWPDSLAAARQALAFIEDSPHAHLKAMIESAIAAATNVEKSDAEELPRSEADIAVLDAADEHFRSLTR